jgi:hypothetical protein
MRLRPSALLFVVALGVAGCTGSVGPTNAPASLPPSASSDVATTEPTLEATVEPSEEASTPPPEITPAPPDGSASPSASTGPGPADACTGTPANRSFFASVASAVDWKVYCADLPSGWFVDSGEYRLAGGGRMEMAYRGPGGARLELHEGAFCADSSGCIPSGTEVGSAPFGDKTGTLISADDGTWALAADSDQPASYLAVGSGVSEDAFRAIAAGLIFVNE